MKKVLLLASVLTLACQVTNAQTLTKANNEPVVGDIHEYVGYDTTSVTTSLPRNTGTGQTWNFSSLTTFTDGPITTTFVTPSSIPSSGVIPGATLAEDDGQGDYTFYKSSTSPSQFELAGSTSSGTPVSGINFTNTATEYTWPLAYGTTFTDTYSGNGIGFSGHFTGTATVTATGTGTITMPGGISFGNILQLKTVRKVVLAITSPIAFTETTTTTQYDYFEPSQKFPLFTVATTKSDDGSGSPDQSTDVTGNKIITVGITNRNFNAQYAIYPNPAKDSFTVKLTNANNDNCTIEIYNITGQLVKSAALGSASAINEKISLSGLNSGIYVVKTALGDKTSSRHLVIE